MSDILARCLGMDLNSPCIVASGPLTDRVSQIEKALVAGAGAVVTKTIFVGEMASISERSIPIETGLLNSTLYSRRPIDYWLEGFSRLDNSPVIASIYAKDPSELGDLAGALHASGCRAFELGIACPNDGAQQGLTAGEAFTYADAVRKSVTCPFSVKLASVSGLDEQVAASIDAGADAISLSDTLPAVAIDTAAGVLQFGEPVGYSGPGIRPIVLQSVFQLRRLHPELELIGIGGINTAEDALEYLQLGCSSVQLYTAILGHGFELLGKLANDIEKWCRSRSKSLHEVIGIAMEKQYAI